MQICIQDWKYPRTVELIDGRVLVEIARTDNNCHHCPTCKRRIREVEAALSKHQDWRWEFPPAGGVWLSLPITMSDKPEEMLQKTLGWQLHLT